MAIVKTFGKEYQYVLEQERSLLESKQTVWYYKLPSLDAQFDKGEEIVFQGDLTNEKKKDITTKFKPANEIKKQAKIIRACLLRIENLNDDEGAVIEWPVSTGSKDRSKEQNKVLAVLHPSWRAELARVFRNAAIVSEEEAKN